MENIEDIGMEEYDGNGFFNSESFLKSYYLKRIGFFEDSLILNGFDLVNNHYIDYFDLSSFDFINRHVINDFKAYFRNRRDSDIFYSYDSLDNLFSYDSLWDDLDRESPFSPGIPANPNSFIGRINTVNHIIRYFSNVFTGRTQHFFLTGNRRMGKTSLINFIRNYMNSYDVASVYISNKGNDSVEFLSKSIIEALLSELASKDNSLKSQLQGFLEDHIDSIEIKGTRISFKSDKYLSLNFKDNFIDYLISIFNEFGSDKKGLLIIVDDINGLSDSREFAYWYKKVADTIEVSYGNQLPVYFLLAGYPEKFFALAKQEPSFGSIFAYENIGRLSDNEVRYFFMRLFKSIDVEMDEEALFYMVLFSMGQPLMMQQIGDSIFWDSYRNGIIKRDDALRGIVKASKELENKQIKDILDLIYNERFNLIIESLIENGKYFFTRSDIKNLCMDCFGYGGDDFHLKGLVNDDDFDEFIDSFIQVMVDLGSIQRMDYYNSSINDLNSFEYLNRINHIFNLDNFDLNSKNEIFNFNGSLIFIYFWIRFFESKAK